MTHHERTADQMSHVPLRARIQTLAPETQDALKDWWANGVVAKRDDAHGKTGLWICGQRGFGTSYVAECATRQAEPRYNSWEVTPAIELVNTIRKYWSLGDLLRRNADDYSLWLEYNTVEEQIDFLWKTCGVLWIDDLHDEAIDIAFWRKHVQPWLELRVKRAMPTIIATTLKPDATPLSGLRPVIEGLFVVCPLLSTHQVTAKPYDDRAER